MNLSVTPSIRVTCVGGSAGTSTGETDTTVQLYGLIHSILVKYYGSPAATIDLQIETLGTDGIPSYQIAKALNGANGMVLPRKSIFDINGIALLYSTSNPVSEMIPVLDKLKITLAQGNDGDYADVWIFYHPS